MPQNIKELTLERIKKPVRFIKLLFNQGKVVYQKKTPFNHIQVVEKGNRRYLIFKETGKLFSVRVPEASYQSFINLDGTTASAWSYADYFHLSWLFNSHIQTILMIGLGGGVIPKRFLEDYPGIRFRTVEIDPEVVEVAGNFFNLQPDPRHEIVIGDGRIYLQNQPDRFDLLILDAFYAGELPYSLFTREFYMEVKEHLNDQGILAINILGSLTGERSWLFRSVYKTLQEVFPESYVFASKKNTPDLLQNIFSFNLPQSKHFQQFELEEQARSLALERVKIKGYLEKLGNLYQGNLRIDDVGVLSDLTLNPRILKIK